MIKILQLDALVSEAVKTKQLRNVIYNVGVNKDITNPIVTIYKDGYTMIDETLFLDCINNGRLILTVMCFSENDLKGPTGEQYDRILEIGSLLEKQGIIWTL